MTVDDKTESKNELFGYADLYLEALTATDPSRLPVTEDFRFTENTKPMKLGEGLWETASAINYRHVVATLSRPVGVFCTLQEGGEHLTLLALRLKVKDKKIAEVETMVSRYAGRMWPLNRKRLFLRTLC